MLLKLLLLISRCNSVAESLYIVELAGFSAMPPQVKKHSDFEGVSIYQESPQMRQPDSPPRDQAYLFRDEEATT